MTTKTKRPDPRPLSLSAVAQTIQAGGSIRQGTVLRRAFPAWEFQVFNGAGEFVAAVAASALPQAIVNHGLDSRPGVNR